MCAATCECLLLLMHCPSLTTYLYHVLHMVSVVVLADLKSDRHLAVVGVKQVHHRPRTTAVGGRLDRQVLCVCGGGGWGGVGGGDGGEGHSTRGKP